MKLSVVAFTTLFTFSALAQDNKCSLKVHIVGLKNGNGGIALALFDAQHSKSYPTKGDDASQKIYQDLNGKAEAEVDIPGLEAGWYAISVFHDTNGDKKLKTNFLGIPTEPTAASNNAKGRMGPPKYEDAKFEVNCPETKTEIDFSR